MSFENQSKYINNQKMIKKETGAEKNWPKDKTNNPEKRGMEMGSAIFSEEELEKINAMPAKNIFIRIINIEEKLPFLSGRNKKAAEKDLADCEKKRDEVFCFVLDRIEKFSEDKKLIEAIKPEDWETMMIRNIDTTNSEKEQQFLHEVLAKKKALIDYLVSRGIHSVIAEGVYEKILEKKREELDLFEGAQKKEDRYSKLTYEYFDPAEEVEKIGKFSEEELKILTPEKRSKIKRERLEQFKAKLAEQLNGISKINAEMEAIILASEDLDRDKLNEYLADQAALYKLSLSQLAKYHYVLDSIELQNQAINKFAKKYANLSSQEVFKIFFGVEPLGEVEIRKGALSFFVVCKNIEDFAFLYTGKNDPESIKRSRFISGCANISTRIFELRGAIIVANASESTEDSLYLETDIEETKIHEERHILYILTREIEELGDYSGLEENNEDKSEEVILKETIEKDRRRIEKKAKDEILAFLKVGVCCADIKAKLLCRAAEEGFYDYFTREKAYHSYPKYAKFNKELLERAHNESRNKYEKNVLAVLEKINWLAERGFPKERIIGLLIADRLDQRPKVLKRFEPREKFENKKNEKN